VRIFASTAAILISLAVASPALAGKGGGGTPAPKQCATTDISLTALSCNGFVSGNAISSSPADIATQTAALAALGLNWNGSLVASFQNLKGATTINFGEQLTGLTYVGVHYGNGQGGPGNATAFYVLDAAQGLNQLHLSFGASSNFVVYATGIPDGASSPAPEPASWAMMVGGFGLIGGAMRSRRKAALSFG
jgi:hypothetical protein